jgi:hypothetical protein
VIPIFSVQSLHTNYQEDAGKYEYTLISTPTGSRALVALRRVLLVLYPSYSTGNCHYWFTLVSGRRSPKD